MDSDILNFFAVMMTLVVTGLGAYAGYVLIAGLQRRVNRGTPGSLDGDELEAMREHCAEIDVLRERVAELETRLDFAERLLSQRSEASRLGGSELP